METGVKVESGGWRQGMGDEESAGELDIGGDGPSISASLLSCMAATRRGGRVAIMALCAQGNGGKDSGVLLLSRVRAGFQISLLCFFMS